MAVTRQGLNHNLVESPGNYAKWKMPVPEDYVILFIEHSWNDKVKKNGKQIGGYQGLERGG